jgi:O-antigen ligase
VACFIFVRALLKIDRQCSPGLSKALWVPTVWFLYCATRPLSEWFQTSQYTEVGESAIESGSFLDRYFLIFLIVIGLIILQKRKINWTQAIKANRWLVVLLVYMLVSILWSDYQFVSLKRWIRTAGTLIMALVVLSEAEPYEAIQAILRRTMYVVIPLSMVLVKYFPLLGVGFGQWSGLPFYLGATCNKNCLGEVCALWMFFYIWTLVGRRDKIDGTQAVRGQIKCEFVLVLMTLYLMKGPSGYGAENASYSATSITVLIMGLGIFFILRRLKDRLAQLGQWVAIALVGYGAVVVALNMAGTSLTSLLAPVLGRNPTLTGRSDLIWDVLLPIAWQHPALGLGFGSFWIKPVPGLTIDVHEAHNGYLDVFLEQGVVGLILVAMVCVMYFRKARNEFHDNFNWAAFRMSYLVMFLLHNWTESTVLLSREILWNLFVLFAVVFPGNWVWRQVPVEAPVENLPSELELTEL